MKKVLTTFVAGIILVGFVLLTGCSALENLVGENGDAGKSAYQLWLENNNTGNESDFLNSLKGATGAAGEQGPAGESAYQTWLKKGNVGDEAVFLVSLKGPAGAQGATGAAGEQGPAGESAYQTWLKQGNEGDEAAFLNSFKCTASEQSTAGEQGPAGESAYQTWLKQGNEGDEATFLNSLKGDRGDSGESMPGAAGANGMDAIINAMAVHVKNGQELRDAMLSKKQFVVIDNDILDFTEEWGIEKVDKTVLGGGHTINAAFHVTNATVALYDLKIAPSFTAEADGTNGAGVVLANNSEVAFYNCSIIMDASLNAKYALYMADTAKDLYLEDTIVHNANTASSYAVWLSSPNVKFLRGTYKGESSYTIGVGNTIPLEQIRSMFIVNPAVDSTGHDLLVLNEYDASRNHKLNLGDIL